MTVKNFWNVEIDYDIAVRMMDDRLREEIHADLAPCTDFVTKNKKAKPVNTGF